MRQRAVSERELPPVRHSEAEGENNGGDLRASREMRASEACSATWWAKQDPNPNRLRSRAKLPLYAATVANQTASQDDGFRAQRGPRARARASTDEIELSDAVAAARRERRERRETRNPLREETEAMFGDESDATMRRRAMSSLGYDDFGGAGGDDDDYDPAAEADDEDFAHQFEMVGRQHWKYVAFYAVSTALALAAVLTTPGLRSPDADYYALYAWIAATGLAYAAVQGSDPGYVSQPADDEQAAIARSGSDAAPGEAAPADAAAAAPPAAALAAADAAADAAEAGGAAADDDDEGGLLPWRRWPPMRVVLQARRPLRRDVRPLLPVPQHARRRAQPLPVPRAVRRADGDGLVGHLHHVHRRDVAEPREGGRRARDRRALRAVGARALRARARGLPRVPRARQPDDAREFMRAEKVDYLRGTEDFDLPFAKGPCSNVWLFVTLDGAYAALRGREWRPHE